MIDEQAQKLQNLLTEFSTRRSNDLTQPDGIPKRLETLEWAVQNLIEILKYRVDQ